MDVGQPIGAPSATGPSVRCKQKQSIYTVDAKNAKSPAGWAGAILRRSRSLRRASATQARAKTKKKKALVVFPSKTRPREIKGISSSCYSPPGISSTYFIIMI